MTKIIDWTRNNLEHIIIGILFLALATQVAQLRLLLDDHVHVFPALLGAYLDHFKGYTYDYGLFRPLGLVFFYFIYTVYIHAPAIAHFIMLALHMASGYLFYSILKKRLPSFESFLIALLFIVFPFFNEQYGWLATSNATVANLVLFSQILIALSKTDFIKKVILIALLQLAGVLLYESVILTVIPVLYLLMRNENRRLVSIPSLLLLILFSLPAVFYVGLRDYVIVPHVASTVREMGLVEIFSGQGVAIVAENIGKFFSNLNFLIFMEGPYIYFWRYNLLNGLKLIWNSGPLLLLLNYLLIGIGFLAYRYAKVHAPKAVKIKDDDLIISFLLFAVFTTLPNLLLLHPTFPFRTLALPLFFAFFSLLLILRRIAGPAVMMVIPVLFLFFLGSSLSILHNMKLQATDDEKFFTQIGTVVDQKIPAGQTTTVTLNNFPHSTRTVMKYGEYLNSCLSTDWCLQAAMNQRTNKINRIIINEAGKPVSRQGLTFDYQKDTNSLVLEQ